MPYLCNADSYYKLWNVRSVVGLGPCADRYDAMLVQFLLTKSTRYLAGVGQMKQAYNLTQDGIFGSRSRAATVAFQLHLGRMIADGRVSPFEAGQTGWDAEHVWTLSSLNINYARLMQGIAGYEIQEAMNYMPFDEEISPELSACLFASMTSEAA